MGVKFKRQRPIGQFIVDFYCGELNLFIEIDGNSHYHKQEYDIFRQNQLEQLEFFKVRFKESEVLFELEEVQKKLVRVIEKLQNWFSPFGGGQGKDQRSLY